MIRQPVVVVLGHVDSGKTSLLDQMRGTAVGVREVGGITQHIGASFFPMETLNRICGPLLSKVGGKVKIPGLLMIDTPGHEVFANLRTRGGSAADISILVVDAVKGFEAQTYESVEILKGRRVPFVVALNKVDMVHGWRKGPTTFMGESIKIQEESVAGELDRRIYDVVGALSRMGFNSEAFWRVRDFVREASIVPVSAKTGEGIPELMAVLVGLTQQYLRGRLAIELGAPRGIVLEVKEEPGLGPTANVILLDGVLKVGDMVALSKREGAIATRVKAIFMPKPLDEMRDPRDRLASIDSAMAAAGVKVVTPDLDGVLASSPLIGIADPSISEDVKREVEREVSGVFISTERVGVVVKADTIGSLEVINDLLRRKGTPVRMADIGPVSRRDVIEAAMVKEKEPFRGAILAFGVKVLPDAEAEALSRGLKIFSEPIIYDLIQAYLDWGEEERGAYERGLFSSLTPPCRFVVLKGFVFRRSDPAIFGVEVLMGRLRQKAKVMNSEGKEVGSIHQIQDRGKGIEEAPAGVQAAVSMSEPTVGRQIEEGEVLYTLPEEGEVGLLVGQFMDRLTEDAKKVLSEIIEIRRRVAPLYGF